MLQEEDMRRMILLGLVGSLLGLGYGLLVGWIVFQTTYNVDETRIFWVSGGVSLYPVFGWFVGLFLGGWAGLRR